MTFFKQKMCFQVNLHGNVIKTKISQNEVAIWHDRMISSDFSLFYRVHNVHEPHYLWRIGKQYPQYFQCYKSVMQIIADISNNFIGPFICSYCNRHYDNLVFIVFMTVLTSQSKGKYYGMIFTY